MTRTFGTITYKPPGSPAWDRDPRYDDEINDRMEAELGLSTRGAWVILAEPHVAMRLKRIFARAVAHHVGTLELTDTPEVADDLTWVLRKWPMTLDPVSAARLEERTNEYQSERDTVEKILSDGYRPPLVSDIVPACTFRGYQLEAAGMLHATGRLLLCDDVGVGKTHSAIAGLLGEGALPAAWVTLTHLPAQAKAMIEEALPGLKVHIAKKTTPVEVDADVILLSYSKLAGWADHLAAAVNTVVFDECQELRRWGSAKYQGAAQVAHQARYALGMTATPMYGYGEEMWNILNVLKPDVLGEKSEFMREWGAGERMVKDPKALGLHLRDQGVMLRRTRADVGRELPPVQDIVFDIEVDLAEVDRLIDAVDVAERLLHGKPQERFYASGEFDMKVRKATGLAKAAEVAALVKMLLESEPVVLWGWHHDVYDRWAELLRDHKPAWYTGRESIPQKAEAQRRFLEGETDLLIMSLRAGAGIDGLQERCHVGVVGELDWAPGIHTQCIGRLWRDGQAEPVVGYVAVADQGADPVIADILQLKTQQSVPMLDPNRGALVQRTVDSTEALRQIADAYLKRKKP